MTFNIALNYSGRCEIVDACRRIVADWAAGKRADIDEETLGRYLYTAGPARPRPPDPHLGRAAGLELPALADRLRRDLGDADAVARLPAPRPVRGDPRLPGARAPLRRGRRERGGSSSLPGTGRRPDRAPSLACRRAAVGGRMQRLLTAAVAVPLALLALFLLPPLWFFVCCAADRLGGRRVRRAWRAPAAPARAARARCSSWCRSAAGARGWRAAATGRAPGRSARPAAASGSGGRLPSASARSCWSPARRSPRRCQRSASSASASPTSPLPIAALHRLQRADPWLVFLLCAIVWLGDTAAYYVGWRFGRHKMAPVVSPKKTWEGAAAGFAIGVVATVVWSLWRAPARSTWRLPRGRRGDRGRRAGRRPGRVDDQARRRGQGLGQRPARPRRPARPHRRHALRRAGDARSASGARRLAAVRSALGRDASSLRLAILGSTGSIGTSTLDVVRHHPERLRVVALAACGRDPELLARAGAGVRPGLVAVVDPEVGRDVPRASCRRRRGRGRRRGSRGGARTPRRDRVVAAMVGAAGLRPVPRRSTPARTWRSPTRRRWSSPARC